MANRINDTWKYRNNCSEIMNNTNNVVSSINLLGLRKRGDTEGSVYFSLLLSLFTNLLERF